MKYRKARCQLHRSRDHAKYALLHLEVFDVWRQTGYSCLENVYTDFVFFRFYFGFESIVFTEQTNRGMDKTRNAA